VSETWQAAGLFVLVYAGLVVFHRRRWLVAWAGVAVAVAARLLGPLEVLTAVNWNVIGIFFGSVLVAEMFVHSRMPQAISDMLINRSSSLGMALMLVILFASVFSIFMDNVVTVLIIAPIALQLTRTAKISPVTVIVALAVASNLQGMAILIGDMPSMLLAAKEKMSFLDFFWHGGRPGIFWFVEIGALAGMAALWPFFRGERQRPERVSVEPVRSLVPLWLILALIAALTPMTYIDPGFVWYGGTVCVAAGAAGALWYRLMRRRDGERHEWHFHFDTLAFLAAVFVLVHMLELNGVVDSAVAGLGGLRGRSPFVVLSIIVWFSVLVSAFIDNVPYIAVMLPLVGGLSAELGIDRMLLALGVLIGSCMGGNITPIGATANIAATSILDRAGRPVTFARFVSIGLPFTVAATAAAYLALYVVYTWWPR
jgi:Na+/H+ antiporter NhaD/arsenite permease-like protein